MPLNIMRRIKFCAGHRLQGHGGKCEHFHGHNYVVEFHITGQEVDEVGRLIDFAILKTLFKGWIDDNWDHGFILWDQDTNGRAAMDLVVPPKLYLLPYNPTAENMVRYLLDEICPKLLKGQNVTCWKIVLWETDDAFAEAIAS